MTQFTLAEVFTFLTAILLMKTANSANSVHKDFPPTILKTSRFSQSPLRQRNQTPKSLLYLLIHYRLCSALGLACGPCIMYSVDVVA